MGYDDTDSGLSQAGGREAALRSVTAFFDTQDAADAAREDLVGAGVPATDVRVAGGQATAAEPVPPHGFWESLKTFFMPDDDRRLYAEGLRRGGIALSVQTDTAAYDRVLEILDRDGAVDIEERSAGWRDEGWSAEPAGEREMAYTPADDGMGGFGASRADQPLFDGPMDTAAIEPGQVVPVEAGQYRPSMESARVAASAPDTAYAAAAPGFASPSDPARDSTATPGMIQPARDISHGRTRVRSYVGKGSLDDALNSARLPNG